MYTQSITREHRALIIIAIDQSTSMSGKVTYRGNEITKAEAVAWIACDLIFELTEKARRTDGIRDYYDIAVVGYSGDGIEMVLDRDKPYIPVSHVDALPYEMIERLTQRIMPDGEPSLKTIRYKQWIKPKASGETPMYEALREVRETVRKWCDNPANMNSFPPIVFNITDGEFSDSIPEELKAVCDQIKEIHTSDGNALLFNIHIAPSTHQKPLIFPTEEEISHGNRYAQTLFDCSSEMPSIFNRDILTARGDHATPPFRGMSYNASLGELVSILNIGSISVKVSA